MSMFSFSWRGKTTQIMETLVAIKKHMFQTYSRFIEAEKNKVENHR